MTIDKNSFVPLYHQLFEEIKKQITKGKLKPGDAVPSESKLITKYNISRGTVRQAMQKLEVESLIEKYPGRGTFISQPNSDGKKQKTKPIKIKPIEVQSIFSQIIQSTTKTPSFRIIESSKQKADARTASMMKIDDKTELFLLERSLSLDSEIWGIEKSYYLEEVNKDFDKIDLLDTVYEQYKKISDHNLILTKFIIEIITADNVLASQFKIEEGVPLIHMIRLSYLENNYPFELSFGTYRADRLRINTAVGFANDESKFSIKALKDFR